MNERIKELARQADAYAWQQIDEGADYDKQPQFFAEKFAELIVLECAGICDQQGRAGWNDDRKAQAKLDRDLIKEHFGVEE